MTKAPAADLPVCAPQLGHSPASPAFRELLGHDVIRRRELALLLDLSVFEEEQTIPGHGVQRSRENCPGIASLVAGINAPIDGSIYELTNGFDSVEPNQKIIEFAAKLVASTCGLLRLSRSRFK